MNAFEIVLIVLAVVLFVFIGGGMVVAARRARQAEAALKAKIADADHALAAAHAGDNGWDAEHMEAAARAIWRSGDEEDEPIAEAHLVQVIDRPGTDADEAVYKLVGTDGTERDVRIRRTGDAWTP
ncbi:MAG: hypothetical protein H0V81_13490 [Solirubrobacterales bacterium]|nr:hypothetical protein [Solirubrobacterales bacterium]